MGSCGGLQGVRGDAGRVGTCVVSTMDSEQRIIEVIRTMRSEIRKLELENMCLRRRAAGAHLRKNATVPIMTPACRESVVMTVRRYAIFQPLVSHRNFQFDDAKSERRTGRQQR